MNPAKRISLVLLSGVVQSVLGSLPAMGQLAAQDGRALDANNRVGTGGYNDRVGNGSLINSNNIIYGNVTSGLQFRGPILERDPGAFTGPTGSGMTDRFIAGSAGVPTAYQPSVPLSTPLPFYGQSRIAPPPPGTVREGFTGTYLGTGTMPQSNLANSEFTNISNWQDQRLGVSTILGTRTTILGTTPGEMLLDTTNQQQNQQTMLGGSPLYGIQPLSPGETTTPGQLTPGTVPTTIFPGGNSDRFRFDQAEVRRMRAELQNSGNQQNQENPQEQNQQQPGQQSLGQPLESPENTAISSRFGNPINNPGFARNVQATNFGQQPLVSPEMQSTTYAEMRRRLLSQENPQIAAMEQQHQQQIARQAAAARSAAGSAKSRPTALPAAPAPSMLRQPGIAMLNAPPVKVTSLATGVRAKGLHDLLASAEDLMRQAKFQSALDRYGMAQQIAPNNPLISLGRANAELGAGAYRQASSELHAVFAADQATLMAQYDVNAWFPADRLSAIRKELADLSAKDSTDEMPEFLLAYISYNTGDSTAVAQHLSEAVKRANGNDPVLRLMESDWKLPSEKPSNRPPADLNK